MAGAALRNPNQGLFKNAIYLIVVILIAVAFYRMFNPVQKINQITLSDLTQKITAGQVKNVEVDGDKITAQLTDGQSVVIYKEAGVSLVDYGITPEKVPMDVKNPSKGVFWPTFLTIILPFLLIGGFIFFMFRSAQGGNMKALSFGKSTARLFGGKKKISFKDVAGLKESKQELMEVVEFLKNPEKFQKLGAEIPKGVLLVGPPGCGKTLLAKAVAGEADTPFFTISASEFVEMFVGVGAARVRDLFSTAKKNAPCVIFVDELDAVGRQRGSGLGGSHDEREQTLNQILVEMDGFETNDRVIVLAATNRPDVLDPALLRPGRFDRRVVIDLPDMKEREEILKIHTNHKPFADEIDLKKIASSTAGFSGADLRNVINEAAIFAARSGEKEIHQKDLEEAIEKVMLGPERRSRVMSEEDKKVSAYHEAGHAIVGEILPGTDSVHKISIISRGMALGYTWSLPEKDKVLERKNEFEDQIAQLLAGRVAEEIVFNEASTGAQNDLQRSTKLAKEMVMVYGMSEKLGPIVFGEREELIFLGKEIAEHKTYSEKVASEIDNEIHAIIENAYQKAKNILLKNEDKLEEIANRLVEVETISKDEFRKIIGKK